MFEFAALLAAIDDLMLDALIATLDQLPGTLPALQAWLEHAARWEFDRRSGWNESRSEADPATAAGNSSGEIAAIGGCSG